MDTVTFNQVIDLIQMTIIIIAMILLYRSVPASRLGQLFNALEQLAKKTDTPVDDTMVSFGKLITQLLTGQAPGLLNPAAAPTPAPATVAVIATTPAPDPAAAGRDLGTTIADELKTRGMGSS